MFTVVGLPRTLLPANRVRVLNGAEAFIAGLDNRLRNHYNESVIIILLCVRFLKLHCDGGLITIKIITGCSISL